MRPEGAIVAVRARIGDRVIAEGEIVFAHLDQSRAGEFGAGGKNFVFTKDHLLALVRSAGGTYKAAVAGLEQRAFATADAEIGSNGGH